MVHPLVRDRSMVQPPKPRFRWPLWLLGATLLTLMAMSLAYIVNG
jgi:hypothetical protein